MLPVTRRVFLSAFAGAALARSQTALRAGAATTNITPPLGSSIAGSMRDVVAANIHDELHVRSLVLDNGQAKIAFAVVDSCAVAGALIARAKDLIEKRAGIPAAHVLVSATHTHSAPPAAHLFQSPPDSKYTDWLVGRIADAVQLAHARLQPARIGWGTGREERLLFNRRYEMKPGTAMPDPFDGADKVKMNPGVGNPDVVRPGGPVDPDVSVLAVETADGAPISVLCSYGLHYVGGTGPGDVTADYFGYWAAAMRRLAGDSSPRFVPILANGCSGNVNNVDVMGGKQVKRAPYEQMQRVADILAAESYRVWRTLDFHDSVPLRGSIEVVPLKRRMPSAADLERARRILAQAGNQPLREVPQIYARETVLLAESYTPETAAPVQAIRIGSLGIGTLPGEAFAELGLEVKTKSPLKPSMVVSLANDYHGYIPDAAAFDVGGYETWRAKSSHLERDAAPKLVAALLRQLELVAR